MLPTQLRLNLILLAAPAFWQGLFVWNSWNFSGGGAGKCPSIDFEALQHPMWGISRIYAADEVHGFQLALCCCVRGTTALNEEFVGGDPSHGLQQLSHLLWRLHVDQSSPQGGDGLVGPF